jgi:hypothetical protein
MVRPGATKALQQGVVGATSGNPNVGIQVAGVEDYNQVVPVLSQGDDDTKGALDARDVERLFLKDVHFHHRDLKTALPHLAVADSGHGYGGHVETVHQVPPPVPQEVIASHAGDEYRHHGYEGTVSRLMRALSSSLSIFSALSAITGFISGRTSVFSSQDGGDSGNTSFIGKVSHHSGLAKLPLDSQNKSIYSPDR